MTRHEISPEELNLLMATQPNSFTLLDVRTEKEFAHGHLQGSINLPIAELDLRTDELSRDLPVIVVCHAGVRSAYALEILKEKGFKEFRHLPGGLMRLESIG
ncbi:MAG: rhodanese-like domain-containing protein [Bdellovibrionia bacterium]